MWRSDEKMKAVDTLVFIVNFILGTIASGIGIVGLIHSNAIGFWGLAVGGFCFAMGLLTIKND